MQYTWQPTANDTSVYQRGLYAGERVMTFLQTIYPAFATVLVSCSLRTALPPGDFEVRLKNAWSRTRFAVPFIACSINAHPTLPQEWVYEYQVPTSDHLHVWLQRSVQQRPANNRAELASRVLQSEQDLEFLHLGSKEAGCRLFWSTSDNGNYHLLLVAYHCMIDGRGAFQILNLICENFVQDAPIDLEWGTEIAQLTRVLQYAANLRSEEESKAPDGLKNYLEKRSGAQPQSAVSLTPKTMQDIVPTSMGHAQTAHITLDKNVIDRIQTLAKRQKTRFAYAVASCVLLSVYENASNQDVAERAAFSVVPSDMRYLLSDPTSYMGSASLARGSVSVPINLIKSYSSKQTMATFWQIVGHVEKGWEEGKNSIDALRFDKEVTDLEMDFLISNPQVVKSSPSEVMFSPIGKVDNYLRSIYEAGQMRLDVSAPFVTVHCGSSSACVIHNWSFAGQLTLNASFGTYSADYVQQLLRDAKHHLEQVASSYEHEIITSTFACN